MLKQIVARRENQTNGTVFHEGTKKGDMPLDEVVEIIELQDFDKKAAKRQRENMQVVQLSPPVVDQLQGYITGISEMYNDNPFHNVSVIQD